MTHYLLSWPPIKVLPNGTRIQLEVDENGELREPDDVRRPDYFGFGARVGRDGVNAREDVVRAQTLLGHAGYFDMERTEGPTGWYGKPLELGIRKFQKDNGLTVDGYMEPGGETLSALEQQFGKSFAPYKPPSLKIIDTHHERRARGEPGLLETDRSKGRPFGVTLQATKNMKATRDMTATGFSDGMMRRPGSDRLGAEDVNVQLASAAPGTLKRGDPIIRSWPEGGPMVLGGGGRGAGGAAQNIGRALDGVTQQPDRDTAKPSAGTAMTALLDGIASGFGKVERHEMDNTRTSSNIIVQECNEVIKERAGLEGFEHKAGASEQGEGKTEKPEKALKNGKLKGGGGHSFPDVLYMDGDKIVAINSATESAPGKYIGREVRSFNKLLTNVGEYVAKITGKKRPEEEEEEYRSRAREICEEAFDEFLQKEFERVQKEQQTQEVEPPSP